MLFSSRLAVTSRELRATIVLAGPLIGGQLCLIAGNVVDVVLAGHLGARVLGAVAVGTSIWSFALIALAGLMMAVSPTLAELDGSGRRHQAVPVLRHALVLAGAAGLLAWVVICWGGPLLVAALSLEPELTQNADAFLHAISFGAPALGVYFAARGLSDGLGVTWPTMAFGLAGLILLTPLGYVLMYGGFGFAGCQSALNSFQVEPRPKVSTLSVLFGLLVAPRLKRKGKSSPVPSMSAAASDGLHRARRWSLCARRRRRPTPAKDRLGGAILAARGLLASWADQVEQQGSAGSRARKIAESSIDGITASDARTTQPGA